MPTSLQPRLCALIAENLHLISMVYLLISGLPARSYSRFKLGLHKSQQCKAKSTWRFPESQNIPHAKPILYGEEYINI